MSTPSDKPIRDYHLFNFLILLLFISLIVGLKYQLIHITCVYTKAGMACKTCGSTRSFERMANFHFNGISASFQSLFFLFIFQALMRPAISYLLLKHISLMRILKTDVVISSIWFVWVAVLLTY
ncbi:MAG: hypothetical protein GC181_08925 [Bacteroidetes bacterium]|nr:hypothetical protein [Bacteroidota bacterium]